MSHEELYAPLTFLTFNDQYTQNSPRLITAAIIACKTEYSVYYLFLLNHAKMDKNYKKNINPLAQSCYRQQLQNLQLTQFCSQKISFRSLPVSALDLTFSVSCNLDTRQTSPVCAKGSECPSVYTCVIACFRTWSVRRIKIKVDRTLPSHTKVAFFIT